MKSRVAVTLLLLLAALTAGAQGPFQPFGLDQARFDPSTCNPSVGCPDIATITAAGVQWIRMAAWWWFLEPNEPDRSQAIPGVYGRLSGLHSYDWSSLDYAVSQAQSAGLNVLLVISAAPPWANGNPDPNCSSIGNNDPCSSSGQFSNGYAPLVADDLRDLSYSLTVHFGSSVQAVEAWNEPNSAAQFNVNNLQGQDTYYWAAFVSQIFSPVHDGVKTANPNVFVVGPAIAESLCSTPQGACDWYYSWWQNIALYATNLWDAMAFNRYPASHDDLKGDMDNAICPNGGPVWVTEVGYDYSNGAQYQSDNMYYTYVDMFNRTYCWTKTFYHDLHQIPTTGNGSQYSLLNPDLSPRMSYNRYRSMTGH